ncbi:MAG: MFS transporter, partial [Anaerolineae bacterium]|nr:MFS transporter [Anaerolineae bacterium]
MNGLLRALRGRSFVLVWSGHSISLLGDRIFQVALAWWVLEETGSAVAMGTLFIVTMIPMLIFLLVGGVMVDRLPRIWLMLFSDVVRGVVVGLFALLAFTDALVLWHVYVLSLISGFVEAFFQPAYRAVIPEIVPEGDLPSANSLSSLSGQFSGIVGPATGAALVAVGGTPLAFALDAVSFFVSGLCLLPLWKLATSTQAKTEASSIPGELREGLGTVTGTPWLWITIAIAGVSNIAYAGPMEVVLPFLIADYHHADVSVLGLFYSAASVGSVIGAVWLGRLAKLRRRGVTLYGAWMIVGLMVALIGLPVPI